MIKTLITVFTISILTLTANSQTTYIWNGSANSSFSTAQNWTPIRQIGLVTDILVFENGLTFDVQNVSLVTIGQLIIRNNTNVTFSPASGNSKTILINGSTGDDFIVEHNSSVTILGNDPQLNIYMKTGTTARISGTLTLRGDIAHNLNAVDSNSIKFKSGSVFNQNVPGSVFTTTGIKNAVVFESGSVFNMLHNSALNPFGLPAPNSKVRFESGSTFNYTLSNPGGLVFSGRNYSNLNISSPAAVAISEAISLPFSADNLAINSTSGLILTNTNANSHVAFTITGNLTADAELTLAGSNNQVQGFELNFEGASNHVISGSANINLKGAEKVTFSNNVELNRDLRISSDLYTYGRVLRNGHELKVVGKTYDLSNYGGLGNTVQKSGNQPDGKVTVNEPLKFKLSQNYPNPFNPSTKIDYVISDAGKVTLRIYDINGREVAELVNMNQNSGNYSVEFNASNLSSGAYFYVLSSDSDHGKFSETKSMVIIK